MSIYIRITLCAVQGTEFVIAHERGRKTTKVNATPLPKVHNRDVEAARHVDFHHDSDARTISCMS
jgi:hypothetical protein